jgi:hypothetical protein
LAELENKATALRLFRIVRLQGGFLRISSNPNSSQLAALALQSGAFCGSSVAAASASQAGLPGIWVVASFAPGPTENFLMEIFGLNK